MMDGKEFAEDVEFYLERETALIRGAIVWELVYIEPGLHNIP